MKESSKHEKQDVVKLLSWSGGLNEELDPSAISLNELSAAQNIQYYDWTDGEGNKQTGIELRHGTTKISSYALPAGADVEACYYYKTHTQYILATSSKLYYLGVVAEQGSLAPIEIGSISGVPTFTEFNGKLIVHDSGVTKAWNGTTFETLACTYEDENIGTGDGAETHFTGTLSNPTVTVSSITITATTAAGATLTVTDNGEGALIGDVNGGGTNTITYSTGAYNVTFSTAPVDGGSVLATYKKVAGAPKSKGGFVRNERLYMWGSIDYPSRLFYSGTSDTGGEYEWDSSSGGGYLDFDKDDGYSLLGCINYSQSVILFKQNKLGRLDNFPGDSIFRIEPLNSEIPSLSHRAILSGGSILTTLSSFGWLAVNPGSIYDEQQTYTVLSKRINTNIKKYASSLAFAEFNPFDNQLWLALHSGSAYLNYIYVIDIPQARVSKFQFAFTHSCFKYVDNKMLIGGIDGNLYQLSTDNTNYLDNSVSYATNTFFATADTDWGLPLNDKITKKLHIKCHAATAPSGNVKLYKDHSSTALETIAIPATANVRKIVSNNHNRYKDLMIRVETIAATGGIKFGGIYIKTALVGDK